MGAAVGSSTTAPGLDVAPPEPLLWPPGGQVQPPINGLGPPTTFPPPEWGKHRQYALPGPLRTENKGLDRRELPSISFLNNLVLILIGFVYSFCKF